MSKHRDYRDTIVDIDAAIEDINRFFVYYQLVNCSTEDSVLVHHRK